MRLAKPLMTIALVLSILINVVLIYKVRGRRAIITVNGAPITRIDMNNALELEYGPQYKATAVERLLVDQEAHAQGVAPTDTEINDQYAEDREMDWSYAQKLSRSPWLVDEAKAQIKLMYEEEHLLAKPVTITDEEIVDEYQQHPSLYDTPNKARCTVAAVLNAKRTDDIKQMLSSQSPPYSAASIMSNYPKEVVFLGNNNVFTFAQAYNTQERAAIFSMEPKSVRTEDPPPDLAQLGAKKMVIRMESIEPGHRADLTDTKTRKKISLRVALKHAGPPTELISQLWTRANLVFEDPADKARIEMLFFPDRNRQ